MAFERAVIFTDIHFGLKGNAIEHNDTCLAFIDWMISKAVETNSRTCIFMGDYFHNRSAINVQTLHYGLQGLRKLNANFDKVYFIVGNHDCFYRGKRDVTSVEFAKTFKNIQVINDITKINDCTFIPFLVKDEWKTLTNLSSTYVFGHLELPGYKLNAITEMPDTGKENENTFVGCKYVLSGHFHTRQIKRLLNGTEVHYTGNAFPHNYGDSWDDNRGCVFLEHGNAPIYHNWPDAPRYRSAQLSSLLENASLYLSKNTNIKVELDINLTSDEVSFIRETYKSYFELSEFKTFGSSVSSSYNEIEDASSVESVDEVVLEQIKNLDSNTLDKALLQEIYINL
jgi:DNA repair exonuclease SbcCD nuclease subunit